MASAALAAVIAAAAVMLRWRFIGRVNEAAVTAAVTTGEVPTARDGV